MVENNTVTGRWVPAKVYAAMFCLSVQSLANWRHRDRAAGRNAAAPGFPVYRRWGKAIRYWLDARPPEAVE
jgi:hypothetical protein